MAYYGGYPNYQQAGAFQQPYQQGQQSGVIWVQGEASAKSYLVAPGSTVALWDSEEKTIYLKSADMSGMPSMRVLDYTIRGEEKQEPRPEYATKEDLAALEEKIKELSKRRRIMKEVECDE